MPAVNRYYSSVAIDTTLKFSITNSDLTLDVNSTSGFPTSYPYTLAIGYDLSNEELVTIIGASYRVAAYLDAARVTGMSVEADAIDQSNPSGAGAQVSRYLFAQYKDRLATEVNRQSQFFNVRVHYTR